MRGNFGSYALLGPRKVRGFCATTGNYQPSVADPRKAILRRCYSLEFPQFLFQILISRQVASLPPASWLNIFLAPTARSLSPVTCLLRWHYCGESHQSLGLAPIPPHCLCAYRILPNLLAIQASVSPLSNAGNSVSHYLPYAEKAARAIQDSGSS
jgi:hypothetical protein